MQLYRFPERRLPPTRRCFEIVAQAEEDELLQCAALPLSELYRQLRAGETVPPQTTCDVAMMTWLLLGRLLNIFTAADVEALAP